MADIIKHVVELEGPKPDIIIQETKSQNGKPMLQMVYVGGGYPTVLKCGVGKVKMLLHCLPELTSFYEEHKGALK